VLPLLLLVRRQLPLAAFQQEQQALAHGWQWVQETAQVI
jgi:hypothetical protein